MTPNPQILRRITDIIPAGPGGTNYTQWPKGSYTGQAKGFIAILATYNSGSNSLSQLYVGFNSQPPALINIGDALNPAVVFNTVEIYNHTTNALAISATVYNGLYFPKNIPQVSQASGYTLPAVTSQATLAAVPSLNIPNGTIITYVDSTSNQLVAFQLRAGGTGTVVPSDYNAVTNNHSWYEVL